MGFLAIAKFAVRLVLLVIAAIIWCAQMALRILFAAFRGARKLIRWIATRAQKHR